MSLAKTADTATAVLFALKLAGVAEISWWLVAAPSLVVLGAGLFAVLVMGTAQYFDGSYE